MVYVLINPHVYHESIGASGLSNNPRMDLMSLWWCMFWLILMCTMSLLEHLDSQIIQEWIGIIERVVVMLRQSIAVFYPATVNKSRPTLELISVLLQAFFFNHQLGNSFVGTWERDPIHIDFFLFCFCSFSLGKRNWRGGECFKFTVHHRFMNLDWFIELWFHLPWLFIYVQILCTNGMVFSFKNVILMWFFTY